jgi:hypothetical protein
LRQGFCCWPLESTTPLSLLVDVWLAYATPWQPFRRTYPRPPVPKELLQRHPHHLSLQVPEKPPPTVKFGRWMQFIQW